MKATLIALSLAAVLPAGVALANDDDCVAPREQWQPREAAMQVAEQKGWTVRKFKIDDGCYEIKGRDSDGRKVEMKLDPATLKTVGIEYGDEDHDDDRSGASNPAPAGSVAPPQNGLFGGAPRPKPS